MNVTNDKYEYKELEWDTEYFGIKSAKVILKEEINISDLQYITQALGEYEFITVVNLNNNANNNFLLGRNVNAFLADVNIQFEKRIKLIKWNKENNIIITSDMKTDERINKIAAKVFTYSRFYNDPFLNKERAYKI